MLTSRERVQTVLEHREADRVPLDLGATTVSGIHVDMVYKLRQALGLDPPGTPVKVIDPYQMLGEVKPDIQEALGIDTVALLGSGTLFGLKLEGWKEWRTFGGTPVLVPGDFNTVPEPNGDLLLYPEGDRSALPSGRMPKAGFYFDVVVRQMPLDDRQLKVEDNLEEFAPLSAEELEHFRCLAEKLYTETDKAIVMDLEGMTLGNIARIPGPALRQPKGIRDVEEWYISLKTRRNFLYKVFERQTEINLANLQRLHEAVGERPTVADLSCAEFGMQDGPLISPRVYRDLFLPFHKQINDWVHQHTSWKTFIHSCGSVWVLIGDFIAAGFDILSPVQTSAADMNPLELKRKFGDRITFWGGGVDTQRTLPYGTTEDVRRQVRERMRAFGPRGGFVFTAVHNIQALVPVENVLAMYETAREHGRYPF